MTSKEEKEKDFDLKHMPNFIKDAPWYLGQAGSQEEPVLFHQRIDPEAS